MPEMNGKLSDALDVSDESGELNESDEVTALDESDEMLAAVVPFHMTLHAESLVCMLTGTHVQTLRVDPCKIGKPLWRGVRLVINSVKLSTA